MVSIKVMGPGWVRADHLVLYANGQKIRETNISDKTRSGIKYAVSWVLPKPAHDLFLLQ